MEGVSRRPAAPPLAFDEMFELSLDLLCIGGLDGYFKRVNPAFEQAFGYPGEALLSRPFLDLVHPEDRTRSREAFARLARGEEVVRLENRNIRADGSTLWLEWSARPIPGEGLFYGAGRDVTDRKRSENLLSALRRVAALVASEPSPDQVFASVADEVVGLLGVENTLVYRYEAEGTATLVAVGGETDVGVPVGAALTLEGESTAARVYRTGLPARFDDFGNAPGSIAAHARNAGIRSAVGSPILVEGGPWGAIVALSRQAEPLPVEAESHIGEFTQLVATAISNAEAGAEVRLLAEEQAALRRVATLVAIDSPPAELFAKVVEELANVFGEAECLLLRDEGDGTASVVASWGDAMSSAFPVGVRLPTDGDSVTATVLREGRPHRVDDYSTGTGAIAQRAHEHGARTAVGCPIRVRGRIWGAIGALRYEAQPFPPETETRITQFADLLATAIANTTARAEVERLAEEQAALRRVATLVAQGASATAVFDAVAGEMEALLDADEVWLNRYESGAEITVVALRGLSAGRVQPGTRLNHDDSQSVTAIVRRTERPARIHYPEEASATMAEVVGGRVLRAVVGAPVVVDGRFWGAIVAGWAREEPPPAGTEERMAQFAELLETAIANADSRDQLTASRARVLAAGDDARRHVVRDLHDGAQQRLVHTIVTLKLAQQALRDGDATAESLIAEALAQGEEANAELRELAHGILPSVLTRGGLRAAVDAVLSRMQLPVAADVSADRFPAEIEASAYFVIAEALTNGVKHSRASKAEVEVCAAGDVLKVEIRDDGVGGAVADGPGLVGIADRVAALGGTLRLESPAGGGTRIAAELPLPG